MVSNENCLVTFLNVLDMFGKPNQLAVGRVCGAQDVMCANPAVVNKRLVHRAPTLGVRGHAVVGKDVHGDLALTPIWLPQREDKRLDFVIVVRARATEGDVTRVAQDYAVHLDATHVLGRMCWAD